MTRNRVSLVAGFLFLLPANAAAHTTVQGIGGFWAGVDHSLMSLDQLCFFAGLAVWTRFHEPEVDARVIAAVFAAAIAGALTAAVLAHVTRIDFAGLLAGMMIAVGVGGASRLRIGAGPLIGIAGFGGALSGAANAEGVVGSSLALFSLGGALANAAMLSYGLLGMRRLGADWTTVALRAGASWIGAVGLMIAALTASHYFGRV